MHETELWITKFFNNHLADLGNSLLGLVGMQERALLLNGEFKTEGVPGLGTTMTLTIPLPLSIASESVRHEDSDR